MQDAETSLAPPASATKGMGESSSA